MVNLNFRAKIDYYYRWKCKKLILTKNSNNSDTDSDILAFLWILTRKCTKKNVKKFRVRAKKNLKILLKDL